MSGRSPTDFALSVVPAGSGSRYCATIKGPFGSAEAPALLPDQTADEMVQSDGATSTTDARLSTFEVSISGLRLLNKTMTRTATPITQAHEMTNWPSCGSSFSK